MFDFVLFPVTYDCNLKCKNCCAIKKDIDIERSIKTISTLPCKWVYITGGEPLLHKDIFNICDRLREAGKLVGLTTNGTVYLPDIQNHVARLGISIDGPKDYHDNYRGPGVYDSAVKLFNACKNCERIIMTTVFTESFTDVKNFRFIINEMKPDYWQVSRDVNDTCLKLNAEQFNCLVPIIVVGDYLDRAFVVTDGVIRTVGCNALERLSGATPVPEPSSFFRTKGWVRENFWQLSQDKSYDLNGVLRTYLDIVDAACLTGGRN